MQSRRDKKKEMVSPESATIVEERDICPLIGAVQQQKKKCAKCGRYGHFALCCQGKSDNYVTGGKRDQRRTGPDRRQCDNVLIYVLNIQECTYKHMHM